MHKKIYETFMELLNKEERDQAISFALKQLETEKIDILTLYQELLVPALIHFQCDVSDEEICIWKEHFRTSIIRTILETCYTKIIEISKNVKKIDQKIVVMTPSFEYHEIGAIMVSHVLKLLGFDAYYIGANTPKGDIISAIRAYQPTYIALSVTNPYNVVITKQITEEVKRHFPEVKIILGGQAFEYDGADQNLNADYILHSFDDIKKFAEEVIL